MSAVTGSVLLEQNSVGADITVTGLNFQLEQNPPPAQNATMPLEWDTLFIMVCSFLSGAMCALVWAQTFTTRVVNAVYDRETVAVAVSG